MAARRLQGPRVTDRAVQTLLIGPAAMLRGAHERDDVTTTLDRRLFLLAGAAGLAASAIPSAARAAGDFRPADFGARGDGRSDDTDAFASMSRAVVAAGGGRIILSRKTYMVGRQTPGRPPQYRYEPSPIIDLEGLRSGVTIDGNGATLRANPGARYGSFDERGAPLRPRMPFYDGRALASPYRFMIRVARSRGPVVIRNLKLDGNIAAMRLGGEWGDTGWQIPMTGVALIDNAGSELLADLELINHGQDGLLIDGPNAGAQTTRRIERVRAIGNGRQGCSIIGGRGYRFSACEFSRTGRGPVASNPGAGVDIEAEAGKQVRDIAFADCVFDDNMGAGMVADSGPSEGVSFTRCRFVGITNWAAWPSKPRFRFDQCLFVGAVVRAFASPNPALATQFVDCRFTDRDPASGRRGYGADGSTPIVDLGGSHQAGLNVAFVRCTFDLVHGGKLPWTAGTIYDSVTMNQASATPSYPRGVYRGRSTIRGPAVLASTRVEGEVTLNGRPVR